MDNKAREINSPIIKQLLDETSPEELAKIDAEMTNNKQQTAVEWYDNQLRKVFSNTTEASNFSHEELLQQAKAMEKEQTEQAKLDAKEIIIIKHTEHGGGEQ